MCVLLVPRCALVKTRTLNPVPSCRVSPFSYSLPRNAELESTSGLVFRYADVLSPLLKLVGLLLALLAPRRRFGVPVVEHLSGDDAIAQGGHGERDDDERVSGLLNGGEDAGQAAQRQHEHGDGRQLTGAAVQVVRPRLDYLTAQDHRNGGGLEKPEYVDGRQTAD